MSIDYLKEKCIHVILDLCVRKLKMVRWHLSRLQSHSKTPSPLHQPGSIVGSSGKKQRQEQYQTISKQKTLVASEVAHLSIIDWYYTIPYLDTIRDVLDPLEFSFHGPWMFPDRSQWAIFYRSVFTGGYVPNGDARYPEALKPRSIYVMNMTHLSS